MAAHVLASELAALVQESKRKNPDLRAAAEKSLADLKALPNTSETQLASDLRKRPYFIRPFVLGCTSKNQKLAASSIACLQRLTVSNGLHPDALKDVLDGLRECTSLSQDVQLKILQLLPALLQNYSELVLDELLVTAVHICFLLLAGKNAVISNTAAATLQQVVVSVFDRVMQEDRDDSLEGFVQDVPAESGDVSVRKSALDAYRLLNDVCLLIDGQPPQFLVTVPFQPTFGLELIESILANHAAVVVAHRELVHILRSRLLPFIIRALSEKVAFPIALRSLRLLPVILNRMLDVLDTECEMVLSLINHMLDPDAGVLWKRVLCMELLRSVHADSDLMRRIFSHFDEEEGRRNIVQDQMAVMVRLASEKPSVIGLGQHSSVPYASAQAEDEADQMAALQAESISGTIGVAMTVKSSTAHGISGKLSSMKVPCLEQLDKTEPPSIPPSYLYSLTLICMNSFSEGLAKYLLPFTVTNDNKARRKVLAKDIERHPQSPKGSNPEGDPVQPPLSRTDSEAILRVPVNPLDLKSHSSFSQITTCSAMVDSCWPALLAAYSTFFHAALDSEFYRGLVRSFQKFTQVAGLLRQSVPRDAFLTTLSKNAMPSGPISLLSSQAVESQDGTEATDIPETPDRSKASGDEHQPSLNSRNLLCLRALLNLGIALGPVLHEAWVIVLEALQQADFLIGHVTNQRRKLRAAGGSQDDTDFLSDVGNEISAVGAAATRLFESTSELTDDSYHAVVSALCGLLRDVDLEFLQSADASSPSSHRKPKVFSKHAQFYDSRLNVFVVDQLMKMMRFNEQRFYTQTAADNAWSVISGSLQGLVAAAYLDSDIRVKASKALLMLAALTASPQVSSGIQEETRSQGLREVCTIVRVVGAANSDPKYVKPCEEEIHQLSLEALRSMLELYGEGLSSGWDDVFAIITSVFNETASRRLYPREPRDSVICKSLKLMRSSFTSLQLVCSDFLTAVPQGCVKTLVTAVRCFTDQTNDFNIALTALPLHANIADLIWKSEDGVQLHRYKGVALDDISSLLESEPTASLSLQVLLSLVSISTDGRPEIRHSAIHTLFRSLDSHAESFDRSDWYVCLKAVIMLFFRDNQETYGEITKAGRADDQEYDSWDETAISLLDNASNFLDAHMAELVDLDGFPSVWEGLLKHFQSFLSRDTLTLSTSVFGALEKILAAVTAVPTDPKFPKALSRPAWDVWLEGNPAAHLQRSRKIIDNQPALMAYLSCFMELHQLDKPDVDAPKLRRIVDQLRACIEKSSPVSYAADLDALSPLQAEVIECLQALDVNTPQVLTLLVGGLSSFITLPFDTASEKPERKGPTFVALSKECMDLLESKVAHREDNFVTVDHSILTAALAALRRPISMKYVWEAEGKGVPTWRKATTVMVKILQAILPSLSVTSTSQSSYQEVWKEVLVCCRGVVSTGLDEPKSVHGDEKDIAFDIKAFSELYGLIVPALGAAKHPEELRRQFARMVYEHSFIHEAHPDDLPTADQEPLSGLSSVHIGRTKDIPASPRAKIGYRLLDALFDLVSDHGESAEYVRLAQAAAPYLILRASVTIKAYVLDQPLRGRMPQPASQRKELLYILSKLMNLESEPKAIPDTPRVACKNKKHLYWVYGLVTSAIEVAQQDKAMHATLTKVIKAVAQDLGI